MKRKLFGTMLIALVLVLLLAACGGNGGTAPPDTPIDAEDVQTIGQGATVFRFEMIDADGTRLAWDVHTDEVTVGAALLGVGLISGEESEWGLMVERVNGVLADWDANQSFWAFYIDGDFAMAGADATAIEYGVTYAFVYTQS